jgi:hypothetical protein
MASKLVSVILIMENIRDDRWAVRVDTRHYGETAVSRHLGVFESKWDAVCTADDYMVGLRETVALEDSQ